MFIACKIRLAALASGRRSSLIRVVTGKLAAAHSTTCMPAGLVNNLFLSVIVHCGLLILYRFQ
jgi:hypothetical protein